MKVTVRSLRKLVREMVDSARPIKIGYLHANIAGDYRYTDSMEIRYNPEDDTVTVEVSETGSVGGMDSYAGTTSPAVDFTWTSKPSARASEIARVCRDVLSDTKYNFKRYGKPTKNFNWVNTREKGFSMANLVGELDAVRARFTEEWDEDQKSKDLPSGGNWSDDPWWKK